MASDQKPAETRLERDLRRSREGYERWRRQEIEDRRAGAHIALALMAVCIGGFALALPPGEKPWWIALPIVAGVLVVLFDFARAGEAQYPPASSELSNWAPLDEGPPDENDASL